MLAGITLLIHSALDFNLQIPASAATFVVILAMAWHTRWLGLRAQASNRQPKKASRKKPADIVNLPYEPAPPKS